MEVQAEIVSNIAKQYDKYQFIPFVSACKISNESTVNCGYVSVGTLNGEEASRFYEEVISTPSSLLSQPSCSKEQLEKTNKQEGSFKQCNGRLTIFHYAQDGNITGIKHFLSKGCDIDIKDMFGWTPLMCAAAEGNYAAVKYLIKGGANLSAKNKQGQTALAIAIEKNNTTLYDILRNGIVKKNSFSENIIKEEEVKYCNLCDCSYKECSDAHKNSIAHLLNCKKSDISTFYHIPENNKGFQIMLKKGWDKNKGLGIDAKGRKFPIKTVLKNDRTCIGRTKEVPKVTHFGPNDYSSVKKHNQPAVKLVREKTYKKWKMQKIQRSNRQKEIDFRRQFNME